VVKISLENKKKQQQFKENGQIRQMHYAGIVLMALLLFLVACRVFGALNVGLFLLVATFVRGIAACDGPELEYILSVENLATIYDFLLI
jgi:hypothetical protein